MPIFLSHRQPELVEYMDREDCDPVLLENTYRQFSTINLLLSKWKKIYRDELRPLMKKGETYQLLDIGFGGGDVSIKMAQWANKDGFDLQVTGIEIDKRAYEFATQEIESPASVTFRNCSTTDLVTEKASFDFVISNHVLHHLDRRQTELILKEAEMLSRRKVIFNDIQRSDVGYLLFTTFARLIFRNSFIVADGLISIKRSYTHSELKKAAPKKWLVKKLFPFRLLLIYEQN